MESIQLKDFIESALVNIAQGINNANKGLKIQENQNDIYCLRTNTGDKGEKISGIQFDVAVTATKQDKGKAGFVIALVSLGGGANIEHATGNEMSHRIKFEIGIISEWT